MFGNIYQGKKVLVTGHTGFKGSWLCAWLQKLGAQVCGVALEPDQSPNHFSLIKNSCRCEICDIVCYEDLLAIMQDFQPEIVFHLAAQPLVRQSYKTPRQTFETNLMGSVNVMESCRHTKSVRAVVVVTTDKCYANAETNQPFREEDPMGGHDPYSASKGACEIAAASYRASFFAPEGRVALATARAGNVIGGGDWAEDRLIPDLVRAAAAGKSCPVRFPHAVRPWQHVLEALSGYLLLGEKLYVSGQDFASAWNFGPVERDGRSVSDIIDMASEEWGKIISVKDPAADHQPHEASFLRLDCSKAVQQLHWTPVWNTAEAVKRTIQWYRLFYEKQYIATLDDLQDFENTARQRGMEWAQ